MNRSDAEIHLANAMRELRMAMAKDEPYAIELLEIHQQASKLMRQMVGARVVKCEDCDQPALPNPRLCYGCAKHHYS